MIVCLCRRVSDKIIRAAIRDGASTVEEVGAACRAGTGCGACHETIGELLSERSSCSDCPRPRLALLSPYLQIAQSAGDTA
jgi:bacterioferritin-associated ferredoxin